MVICNVENQRTFHHQTLSADYIITGGGLTGVCSAITAAREGVKVILVQDRPVLGGNASSEVRLWALGATSHMGNNNRWAREGGVLDEILVENTYRNKEGNPALFDMVLIDKVIAEKNITLLLNTVVYKVNKSNPRNIESVEAINPQNGTEYTLQGKLFADCSGDGAVAYLSGASFRMGAEDSEIYKEGYAPNKKEYGELLGHSILFYIKDTGHPVKYTAPDFALKNISELIPKLQDANYLNVAQHGCKYWWLEYGGRLNTITDTEEIKYELWRVVYGVWDYIKNSGKFPQAKNLTLEWAGLIPGKRESRRFVGLYTITQRDLIEQHTHYDAVAYGGWAIDLHPSDGVYSNKRGCNQWHSKGVYQIPYRCYVTPDLDNLFIAGRIMSSSHVANGSTRVMCTAALGGQVIGMAAKRCLKDGCMPAEYAQKDKIKLLQQDLIKSGQFIPQIQLGEGVNLLHDAQINASSELNLTCLTFNNQWFKLDYPAAQLLPVSGQIPKIRMKVKALCETELRVELRSSSKLGNYTPDIVDEFNVISLKEGEQTIEITFDTAYKEPQYVFISFMTNQQVYLAQSDQMVSGITAVFNYINPAVSNFGKQIPPQGIGVEEFEFWCPKRRPGQKNFAMEFSPALHSGFTTQCLRTPYYRPYLTPNCWIADTKDSSPCLEIKWKEEQTISKIRLFFDTDFDHAMESVQMGHYDAKIPYCISSYSILDDNGKEIIRQENNHQTMNTFTLDKICKTNKLTINFGSNDALICRGLMGLIIE